MKFRPARLLLAFSVGLGCSIVLTFPTWSLGTIRTVGDITSSAGAAAKLSRQADPGQATQPRIIIERQQHTLKLSIPGEVPVTIKVQGAHSFKAGTRSVVGKELEPLWKAPPTYFLRRGQEVPSDDSPARFLRGALGHQAIVLDGESFIHSGPVWNDDVGGLKIAPSDMALLFDRIGRGAAIEIR